MADLALADDHEGGTQERDERHRERSGVRREVEGREGRARCAAPHQREEDVAKEPVASLRHRHPGQPAREKSNHQPRREHPGSHHSPPGVLTYGIHNYITSGVWSSRTRMLAGLAKVMR